jgi:uncharacterized protein YuzE
VEVGVRYSYDTEAGALYIYVHDEIPIKSQVEMPDGVVVDVGPDGQLVGVEVLSPDRPWDIQAVVDRFSLTPDEGDDIAAIARSPLMGMRTAGTGAVTVTAQTSAQSVLD